MEAAIRRSRLPSEISPLCVHPVSSPQLINTRDVAEMNAPTAPIEDDERLWEQAMTEASGPERKAGLWAKCFAAANGNETEALAAYLNARVPQLRAEQQNTQTAQAQAAKDQALATQLASLPEDQRNWAMASKGICPSCAKVILLNSEMCPHCSAIFGVDSAWKVAPLAEDDPRSLGSNPDGTLREGVSAPEDTVQPGNGSPPQFGSGSIWPNVFQGVLTLIIFKVLGVLAGALTISAYFLAKKYLNSAWAAIPVATLVGLMGWIILIYAMAG